MEDLINNIKSLVRQNGEIGQEDIDRLTALFRERGISVMALEKLLNFYMSYEKRNNEIHVEAFVSPDKIADTSYDILKQELEKMKRRIKEKEELLEKEKNRTLKLCRLRNVLMSISVVLASFVILLLCFK